MCLSKLAQGAMEQEKSWRNLAWTLIWELQFSTWLAHTAGISEICFRLRIFCNSLFSLILPRPLLVYPNRVILQFVMFPRIICGLFVRM